MCIDTAADADAGTHEDESTGGGGGACRRVGNSAPNMLGFRCAFIRTARCTTWTTGCAASLAVLSLSFLSLSLSLSLSFSFSLSLSAPSRTSRTFSRSALSLLPSALYTEVVVALAGLLVRIFEALSAFGLFRAATPSVHPTNAAPFAVFAFGDATTPSLSLAGATGDAGTVAHPIDIGDEGAEDGGTDATDGLLGGTTTAEAPVFVRIFFARLVLAFSSSSDDGYDPDTRLACFCSAPLTAASCLASCARAPYDGARLSPAVVLVVGG
ncbi:hypothetical protein BDZ97DRAFT_1869227 [Flammula alnicola]|nr:hypothetical protein BDZ97DRAFT_1869227 [Flammula alnicola]